MQSSEYIQLGQLILGVVGLVLVVHQLRVGVSALARTAEANELSAEAGDVAQLMVILALENQLGDAKIKILEATHNRADEAVLAPLIEHFLNTLDRFCHCVRLGLVNETTYRKDYKGRIKEAIRANPKHFTTGSPFLHIVHVDRLWTDEQDAADLHYERKKRQKAIAPSAKAS